LGLGPFPFNIIETRRIGSVLVIFRLSLNSNTNCNALTFRCKKCSSHDGLLLQLNLSNSLASSHHVLVLDAHDTTTPVSAKVDVFVESELEGLGQSLEVLEVFLVYFSKSEAHGSLHVNELSEVGLASDKAEWHSLLSAESWEEADNLNGVNVVGNHDQLGSAVLDQLGHVVETKLDVKGLGAVVSLGCGSSLESCLLFGASLGAVFCKQFKEFTGLISLDSALELSDCWRNLQALHENSLLALNSNILGPLDEAREVSLGLDVSPDSKVAWVLFEQRILFAGARCGTLITNEHCSFSSFFDHNQ